MSKIFAENLKAYRHNLQMTQQDLAKAAGITRSSVNNYESATSEPSFEVLCKFAKVLGVEITDLILPRDTNRIVVGKAQVTDAERALLQAYRQADPVYQGVALEILRQHNKRRDV